MRRKFDMDIHSEENMLYNKTNTITTSYLISKISFHM